MEKADEVSLQILHFNDTYDIENTPVFTGALLSKKAEFLQKHTPKLVENNLIVKQTVDLEFKQTKCFGLNKSKRYNI